MNGFNRVVLSNLWLFKPLLLHEFKKNGPTEAMVRTTIALTIFNAGDKDSVLPGIAGATGAMRSRFTPQASPVRESQTRRATYSPAGTPPSSARRRRVRA
jgi:hypothetical protein